MTLTKKVSVATATSFLACGAILCGVLADPGHAAEETVTQSSHDVLKRFRGDIAKQSLAGDEEASADLEKFDSLTQERQAELAGYLDGSVPIPTETVGDLQVERSSGTRNPSGATLQAVSSTTWDVWAAESFNFAGIKISETKATGKYVATGASVRTLSQGCTVERSYNPPQSISSENNGHYIHEGKAVFECKVTSIYGVPNFAELSRREGIQFIEADADGNVTGSGWR